MTARLREATLEEKVARDRVTHAAWGQRLTVEQFLAREQALRGHPWTRAVMRTWLWGEPGGPVLASCETFEVPSRVGAVAGRSWSIASVFVAPGLRGHGYASALLGAVAQRLAGEAGAQALVLFSEVGPGLYARLGFAPVAATDVVLPAAAEAELEGVTWLEAAPAPPAAVADAGQLVLDASGAEVDWHLERERFYQQALGRRPLLHHGAQVGPHRLAWTAYFKTDELHVLWMDAAPAEVTARLISAAQAAAGRVGLTQVRVWETERVEPLPIGAHRVNRDDEVPMFKPLGGVRIEQWRAIHRALWV